MEDKRKKVDISEHRLRKLIMLEEESKHCVIQRGFVLQGIYEMSMDMAPELAREVLKLRDDLDRVLYTVGMEAHYLGELRNLKRSAHWLLKIKYFGKTSRIVQQNNLRKTTGSLRLIKP